MQKNLIGLFFMSQIPNAGDDEDEKAPPPKEMTSMEATFEKLEQDVIEVIIQV